jgi:hypothetical protein
MIVQFTEVILKMERNLKMNNLFNQSKPASEYPKDWYVIPTMEVIEMFQTLTSEVIKLEKKRQYWEEKYKKLELKLNKNKQG